MKILFINEVCGITSTGRITCELADKLTAEGHECRIAYGRKGQVPERWQHYGVRIGGDWDVRLHALQTRLFDLCGFGSAAPTRRFLAWADTFDPDLIWIHNLHGYYIQVELLFAWLKSRPQTPVRWTLHDCWAFTGHCTYFSYAACEQWKSGCTRCSQLRSYPKCVGLANVRKNYERKKAAFTGAPNLTLLTPSRWLADLVKQSFLKEYPVEVHYNDINTSIFKPSPSNFRQQYGLQDKIVLLGVANVWDERKGLLDFIRLAGMLDDRFALVLVGLKPAQIKQIGRMLPGCRQIVQEESGVVTYGPQATDEKCVEIPLRPVQESRVVEPGVENLYQALTGAAYAGTVQQPLPMAIHSLICVPRTHNAQQLAKVYTAANWLLNPTREDNYPTVNLEAQACGTRVLTYRTGGAPETIWTGRSEE